LNRVNTILTDEVNIWAFEKDISIKLLLVLLTEALSADNFHISQNHNLDVRSVRLFKKDNAHLSAYIYTYGQPENCYGLHLEYPFHDEMDISSSMDIHEGLSFESLLELLAVHFDLTF